MKKRVFISFDFDNDSFLRDAMVAQAKLPSSPFQIEDWSVNEPWKQSEWEEKCLTKIKKCHLVIVMVGEKTSTATGVKKEIQMANEAGVPVVGIKGYKAKSCPAPEGLEGYYNWTWPNVATLLNGGR